MAQDDLVVGVDKLPLKRLAAVGENGIEQFATEVPQEEKPLNLLRRIDYGSQEDTKKPKASSESQSWKNLMLEDVNMAQQELSYCIDLISHVEANEAVAVAGMTRPKQQPSEHLSDLAISASTKLKAFRDIGKYMKQASKGLEEQVVREAKFYGALMRLQRNWKVKREKLICAGPGGNAGFAIDLSDHVSLDLPFQTSKLSAVGVDQDKSGMLSVNQVGGSKLVLNVGFQGGQFGHKMWEKIKVKMCSDEKFQKEGVPVNQDTEKWLANGIVEHVNEGSKQAHSILREMHCATSDEKVFSLIQQEALKPSGISVSRIRENFLQLRLCPDVFLNLCLLPSHDNGNDTNDTDMSKQSCSEIRIVDFNQDSEQLYCDDHTQDPSNEISKNASNLFILDNRLPNALSSEVHLQQLFHQHIFARKYNYSSACFNTHTLFRSDVDMKVPGGVTEGLTFDAVGPLQHFCKALSHRVYCYKVLLELENLVKVPYLHLFTHPTWHCCISSWYLYLTIPQTVTQGGQANAQEWSLAKKKARLQFRSKILVQDENLSIEAEGTPNVGCLFKGSPTGVCVKSEYNCGLSDLASMLLHQVASQLIYWLHEEALAVGMKVERDYLSLSFQLDDGDSLSLVASIDLQDYCVVWWLIFNYDKAERSSGKADIGTIAVENKKLLGPLTLESLYAVLMDLVTLCGRSGDF